MQYYTTDFGCGVSGTSKGFLFGQPRKKEARVIFYENVNQEFTSEHEDSAIERLNLLLELLCKASKKHEDTHEKKQTTEKYIFTDLVFPPNNPSPTNLYFSPEEQRQYFNTKT